MQFNDSEFTKGGIFVVNLLNTLLIPIGHMTIQA